MAISLHDLTALLNKQAATPKPKEMTPGQQAMVGAAQAAGNIPGAVKAPNVFPANATGSPGGDALAEEEAQKEIQDQLTEKDQEIERVRKERNNLELQLHQEQMSRQQAEAEASIAAKEREFEASMQAGKEELERERTRMQAEETEHQAVIDKQTAEQSVTIAEEKAKMMTDFANQQAQRYVKTTEDAAKNIAKQRDDSYKQIDNYRQQSMQAIEAARPAVSPALAQSMTGALDAMGRINKINQRLHSIPKPGSLPLSLTATMAQEPQPADMLGKSAGLIRTERPTYAQQERWAQEGTQPQEDNGVDWGKWLGWGAAGLAAVGGIYGLTRLFGSGGQMQDDGTYGQDGGVNRSGYTPNWGAPFGVPMTDAGVEQAVQDTAAYQQRQQQEPQTAPEPQPTTQEKTASVHAQLRRNRLVVPIPGGMPKVASQISLANQSLDLAHIDNAIWEAQRDGDEALEQNLTQSRAALQQQLDARRAELDKLVASGDQAAQREIAAYNDLHRKYTVRGNNPAGLTPGGPSSTWSGLRSLFSWLPGLDDNPQSSAYDDIANRSQRDALRQQYDENTPWYMKLGQNALATADEFLFGMIGNGTGAARENYNNMQEMAKDRGVNVNWFGANTGDQAMLDDFNQAAARYNVSTNPWAHAGDWVGNAALGAAGLLSGGVASGAIKGITVGGKTITKIPKAIKQLAGYTGFGYGVGTGAAGLTSPDTPENAAGWQKFFNDGFGGNYGQWGGGSIAQTRTPYGLPAAEVANAAQQAAQVAQQPQQPQQTQRPQQNQTAQLPEMPKAAAVETEYSKRPIPTDAQGWNTQNPGGMFDTKTVADYYGDGFASWLPTLSPMISAFTGGTVNLIRTPQNAYNSAYVMNPQEEMQRLASTKHNPIFRDPGQHSYATPMGGYLQQQFGRQATPLQIHQPTWEQMGSQMA